MTPYSDELDRTLVYVGLAAFATFWALAARIALWVAEAELRARQRERVTRTKRQTMPAIWGVVVLASALSACSDGPRLPRCALYPESETIDPKNCVAND